MDNITLDSSSFSEQLGIYDFFNVLVSGFIFLIGVCLINTDIMLALLEYPTVPKALFIVVIIYVLGLLLQEAGSFADRKIFNFYTKGTRSILKSSINQNGKISECNDIITNPLLLEYYRQVADTIIPQSAKECPDRYECDNVNGFVFSVFQYYISASGKDKKVEKMRALFSMSKTLMSSFGILAFLSLSGLFRNTKLSVSIWDVVGLPARTCVECIDTILLSLIFALLSVVFYFRTKKTMRRFLLILLGTYDAIVRLEKKNTKV